MEQTQNPQPPVFDQQPQGPQYEAYIPELRESREDVLQEVL